LHKAHARQSRRLTLKQVAERTGLALSTLSKVENGLMSLTSDKLLQLTGGLKMEIAELFNAAGNRLSAIGRSPPAAASVAPDRGRSSTPSTTPTSISAPI